MKQISKYFPSVCGYIVTLLLNVNEENVSEDLVSQCLADDSLHSEEKLFDRFEDAQNYLLKTLQEYNPYYAGVIFFVSYGYEKDDKGELHMGECKTHVCVAEAYAKEGGN